MDKPDDVTGDALDEELAHALHKSLLPSSTSPIPNHDTRSVQTSINTLSLKVGRLDKRLDLIDDSCASLSNEVAEIKQDLKTVLDILLSNPPPVKDGPTTTSPSTTNSNSNATTVTPASPPPLPLATPIPSTTTGFKQGVNIVIDIGSNKPEMMEITLDDGFESLACERFRKYLSERLASESRNGPPQTESQIEMLVWNSTYTYINNFNIGALSVPYNYGDSKVRYRSWSVAMWGKKAGDHGPYDVSQVLFAEESIFALISDGKLSGEWIVFGQVTAGRDFCKGMISKGNNKKGFIGFKQ